MASAAEENAHLLYQLKNDLGAVGFGMIHNFFETEPSWRCCCCFRSKAEIARLDRHKGLLCRLVYHHDHFEDHVRAKMGAPAWGVRGSPEEVALFGAREDSFVRFSRTLICEDCNVAETAAKRCVHAPDYFSFAPFEIAAFVIAQPNVAHKVDAVKALEVYEACRPTMRLLCLRLNRMTVGDPAIQQEEGLKPFGMYATRVLAEANKARQSADEPTGDTHNFPQSIP